MFGKTVFNTHNIFVKRMLFFGTNTIPHQGRELNDFGSSISTLLSGDLVWYTICTTICDRSHWLLTKANLRSGFRKKIRATDDVMRVVGQGAIFFLPKARSHITQDGIKLAL